MNKVNILLTEANGNLSNEKEMIENAIKMAEEYAFSKLNIDWDIDVLVTNRLYDIIIPEDGVSAGVLGLPILLNLPSMKKKQPKA